MGLFCPYNYYIPHTLHITTVFIYFLISGKS
nr:MAG TPA: hypothetical protein [Caudoviricetes sp.]